MKAFELVAILITLLYRQDNTESKEVCHNEFFSAKCPEGHVVLMTSSLYGRMRSGRCVRTSFGYTGCYADVLEHTHERCSGRQFCQIKVPDASMDAANPCNDDLISYLDANFTCIKDTKTNDSSCQVSLHDDDIGYIVINDDKTISNADGQQSIQKCGFDHKPWILQAGKGQQINLTLYDFTPYLTLATGGNGVLSRNDIVTGGFYSLQSICSRTIVFRESNKTSQISPCRFSRFTTPSMARMRQSHLHLSTTNEVQLYSLLADSIPSKYEADYSRSPDLYMNLVIRYEVTGCSDLLDDDPSKWRKREGDKTFIGCKGSEEKWETICDGKSWRGIEEFNCSAPVIKPVKTRSASAFLPLGASIFVVIIMSVTVGLMVLVMGVCFMRRRKFCSVVDQAKDEKMMREMRLISTSDLFKRPVSYSSTADNDLCDNSYCHDNATNSNIDSSVNKSNLCVDQRTRTHQPSCSNLIPVKTQPCKMAKSLKATVADCCNDNVRNREALMHYEYVWQANTPEQQQQQQQQQQATSSLNATKIVNSWMVGEQEGCCSIASGSCQGRVPHELNRRLHHLSSQQHRYHHQMQVPTVVFLQASSDSRPDLLRLTSTARTNTFYNARDTANYRTFVPGTLQVNLTTSFEETMGHCKSLLASRQDEPNAKPSTSTQKAESTSAQETQSGIENSGDSEPGDQCQEKPGEEHCS